MSETNYFRLIDAYFEGTITPADKAMLEAQVKSDPLLKAEFDLQKNIVQGISNSRKMELKSRLTAIDLPSQIGLLAGGGAKWLAGTVAGVTIFGSVLYWSLISFDDSIKPIDLKTGQEIEFHTEYLATLPKVKKEKKVFKAPKNLELKVGDSGSNVLKSKDSKDVIKEESNVTAIVQPQALISYEDDQLFTNQNEDDLNRIESREVAHNRVDKTEIEFLKAVENQDNYHYRYFNSKLYLYGDFKDMPYQIIELNDKGKKQLFLSHNEEVYIIKDKTTEITELRELQDEMLKMEIQLIVEE
ncbi:hypothetical protein [Marivirga harenae]|uniref:hypothetical protein n=1 Tax=Marivirga harenae TaxID=2010992 RepID=UPI0026DFA9FA|nr:hypothetical protein [Marivirga harenae]WKV11749.1 hypothetical protein Q3Y49_16225 [Marivirga harenae]|tara:strand:+ start:250381 stop:251280 length:900 start_codon:yes stop_codon:yes gene_type:complete